MVPSGGVYENRGIWVSFWVQAVGKAAEKGRKQFDPHSQLRLRRREMRLRLEIWWSQRPESKFGARILFRSAAGQACQTRFLLTSEREFEHLLLGNWAINFYRGNRFTSLWMASTGPKALERNAAVGAISNQIGHLAGCQWLFGGTSSKPSAWNFIWPASWHVPAQPFERLLSRSLRAGTAAWAVELLTSGQSEIRVQDDSTMFHLLGGLPFNISRRKRVCQSQNQRLRKMPRLNCSLGQARI